MKRSLNKRLATFQRGRLKNAFLFSLPFKMTVGTGNVCNLECALCPVGQKASGRDRGFMPLSRFKDIVDRVGVYLYEMDLFNWGEPLLNQEIFQMIRYAKKSCIRVTVSSNLNRYDDSIGEELIASNLDTLLVSLDGASRESVSAYQKGNDFEVVIANIKSLVRTRSKREAKHPEIRWRYLVNRHNEGEIETAQRLAEELGVDQLDLAPLRCDMGRELFMDNEAQIQSAEPWLPAQEGLSLYDYAGKEKKRVREKDCDWLWTRMVVNWNGSVSPCCAVWDEKYDFGNVDQRSFFRIWNGKRYRQARRIVAGREPPASDNVCGICVSHRAQI